jgi:hypothetical protein
MGDNTEADYLNGSDMQSDAADDARLTQMVQEQLAANDAESGTGPENREGWATGPLGDLYADNYGGGHYVFPRDLNSLAKGGHVVRFEITDVKPYTLEELKNTLIAASSISGEDVSNFVKDKYNEAASFLTNATSSTSAAGEAFTGLLDKVSTTQVNFLPRTDNSVKDTIDLFMPESVNFNYGADYNQMSATDTIPLVGKLSRAIQSSELIKAGLYKAGYVLNPQQQVMFNSIDFRKHQMSFTFTPFSPEEAESMRNIIKALRRAAAPTIVSGLAGFFFTPPSYVDVTFLFRGGLNPNLNMITRCVIENVSVDYAPNGWSAHIDGSPTQVVVTVDLMETVLVDRNKVLQGY